MKKKINFYLVANAIFVALVTMVSMTAINYHLFEKQVKEDLKVISEVVEKTDILEGRGETVPEIDVEGIRITWIDTDGTVLYDNENDVAVLENHLDRPEVAEALENGEADIVRASSTMNSNTFYHAIRLDDGTVLRVSLATRSIWSMFAGSILAMACVAVAIAFICIILARSLTRNLMRPIEGLSKNLENTALIQENPEYKELIPFMNEIRSQHENVLAAAKSRQDFTANVSHELKTPLTAISGYAELIENGIVDQEQQVHFASEIKKNAQRLLSLINDIIRLSELDGRDKMVEFEQLDLCAICEECANNLRVTAYQRNIEVNFDGTSCIVRGNRHMLTELIENLGQNAIRYNNPGGTVNITVHNLGRKSVLTVEDDGIGIPKDQQERVFERFYRVDKSRSKETGGTGLGLAIVKHIVELHDAKLTLDSEPDKGTIIKVEF